MKKYHLLAPGPTPIPPEVLQAIARPILHHRTPEFEALFGRVRAGLAEIIETRSEVIVLAASGTGALEAAVVNLLLARGRGAGRPLRQVRRAVGGHRPGLRTHRSHGRRAVRRDGGARAGRGGAGGPSRGARALRDAERDVDRRARGCRGLRGPHAGDRHAVRRGHRLVARGRAVPDGRLGHRRRGRGLAEGAHVPAGPRVRGAERPSLARGRAGPMPPLLLGSSHRAALASEEPGAVHARCVAPRGARRRPGAAPSRGSRRGLPAPRPARARGAGGGRGARARALRPGDAEPGGDGHRLAGGDRRRGGRPGVRLGRQHHHRGRAGRDEGEAVPARPSRLGRRVRPDGRPRRARAGPRCGSGCRWSWARRWRPPSGSSSRKAEPR